MDENQRLAIQRNRAALAYKYPTKPKAEIKAKGIFPLNVIRGALQRGYLKSRGY